MTSAGAGQHSNCELASASQKTLQGELPMNRIAISLSIAAAFAAGCGVTHLLRPASAADAISAQIIHTGELEGDAISPANAGGMRNKTFVSVDGATISIQDGSPPKHLHADANEIQYILEGKGTIWLGDKEVAANPRAPASPPQGPPHAPANPRSASPQAST